MDMRMNNGDADGQCLPLTLLLQGDGLVPNNPQLAVLHYQAVFELSSGDLASQYEALFARYRWPPAWRSGIYGFDHFHSTAHEVLGIYCGEVTVRLGGEAGVDVVLRAGDVAVLPAGVAHKQLRCCCALGVVGAYPCGQVPDACRPDAGRFDARVAAVSAVALPSADPVYGAAGPLLTLWAALASRKGKFD
jgi:uncharacterized protein YjlB